MNLLFYLFPVLGLAIAAYLIIEYQTLKKESEHTPEPEEEPVKEEPVTEEPVVKKKPGRPKKK
jgi:hypothetical protein